MKRYLITIAAFLLCCITIVEADKKSIAIIHVPPITPQGLHEEYSPTISGQYDNNELTININGYIGDVTFIITDNLNGQDLLFEEESVFWNKTVNYDITNLSSSTYTLYIILDNGDTYFATLQL